MARCISDRARPISRAGLLLGASLVALLAVPASAQDADWKLNPENTTFGGRSDYQDPGNWVQNVVPTGIARFGPTNETDIFFENQVNQQPISIDTFLFAADAPAYTFSLQSDQLTFEGTGIDNNSSAVQTLITGNRSTLTFANSSSADNAALRAEGNTGFIVFRDSSRAANSTITAGIPSSAGVVNFLDNSTAENATILVDFGNVNFRDNSSAGDATIENSFGIVFNGSSSLGTSNITGLAGGIRIFDGADGPDGTIDNRAGSTVDVSQISGGAPDVSIGSLFGDGAVRLGGRTLTLGNLDRDDTIGGAITDGGDLGGTGGSLTKVGTGTLTLTGDSSYTGATTVNGGTLLLTGSITGAGATVVGSGSGADGRLTIQGGATLTSTGNAAIGEDGGSGVLTVTGAGSALTVGGNLAVGFLGGDGGFGRLNVENGATVTSASGGVLFRAMLPASDGRVSVTGAGSVWNSGDLLIHGPGGTDIMTIAAGGTVNSGSVNLAGSVLATGAGSSWNTGHLVVGPNLSANGNPAGRLTIASGAVVESTSAVLGEGGSFTSSVTIDGAGSAWTVGSDLVISPTADYSGQVSVLNGGKLTVDAGTGTIAVGPNGGPSFFTIGGGAPGTLPGIVEAASLSVGSGSILAFDHAATNYVFALPVGGSGRILVGSGTTILTGDSSAFAGTTEIFSGATLRIGSLSFGGSFGTGGESGALGGSVDNDGALVLARAGTVEVNATISGTGSLTHIGHSNSTTTLTAGHSYTGATIINGGTLLVNGSIASSSGVTINGGGTLGGTGTVASTSADGGGTIAPGASLNTLGTLAISGNLTLGAANFIAQAGPASADLIDISGTADLDGRIVAVATGGDYAPGQHVLLEAAGGRSGEFATFATDGNFGGLFASLSYTATGVILNLATFTGGGDFRWRADPATANWNTGTNWESDTVPTGTAIFGASTRTTIGFSPGTTQIGGMRFEAGAPAYTFQLDSGLVGQGGGDILNFLGDGIVNDSASQPTFQVVSTDTVADGGGAINFFNSSSAGNALFAPFNSGNIFGSTINFYQTSDAGSATFDNVGQGASFHDSSSAADATLNNGSEGGLPGAAAFFDDSSAGHATINNPLDLGGVVFFDSSTAGSAQILNRASVTFDFGRLTLSVAGVVFADSASAGTATITNDDGSTGFLGTSSAADATIVNSHDTGFLLYSTLFAEDSDAGSATITNNDGGITQFQEQADAGSATIVNNSGGSTIFYQAGSAGAPTITNNDGGMVRFRLTAQGGDATIVNNSGGAVDISEEQEQTPALVAPSVSIGSLSGAGDIFLGARNLSLGGLDGDETIAGTIANGGEFGGTGGSLTKVGTGTLTLSGANTYTGVTTIDAGTLQIGDGGTTGSVAGDIAIDAALVVDRSGVLTLAGAISGDGTFTKNGTVTTTLSGTSSFTGATTVNGGTLLVTGSIADSLVTVNAGATLGGTGTVGGTTLTDGGMIAPGTSIGTLTVDGDLVFGDSNYLAEVAPSEADLILVAGEATLDGILTAIATGGTYTPGEFVLLTADGGLDGSFDELVTQGSFSGLAATLEYEADDVVLVLAVADGTPDWDGSVSTDWFINGNWDNDSVPTATTDASINTRSPNPTVIAATGARTANLAIGTGGGTGHLTIEDGGTLASSGSVVIGEGGGVGEVHVTGSDSAWTIAGSLLFAAPSEGTGTSGTLRIDGGATVSSDSVELNQFGARSSLAVVSGAGTIWNTGDFSASGLANLTGDMVTVEAGATVNSTGSTLASRMTVTGASTVWNSGDLLIGSSSGLNPGRLTIADGATVNSSAAQLGFSGIGSGSRGFVEVTAATWIIGSDLTIGVDELNAGSLLLRNGGTVTTSSGTGTAFVGLNSQITIGGAAAAAPGILEAARVDLASSALLTFSHNSDSHVFAPVITGSGDIAVTLGTTILAGDSGDFAGTTTIGAGGVLQIGDGGATGALGGDIVNDNQLVIDRTGELVLAGAIFGTGSLVQNGDVTTSLTAENGYGGATTVNNGTLLVTGSIAASEVTVNEGATLGGTGTVGSTSIADGGTVAPGMSIGTLSVGGDFTFASDSRFLVEIAPDAADLLDIAGSAALAGTLEATDTGGIYVAGQEYTVLTAGGGITGTFGAFTLQGDFSGLEAELRYDSSNVFLVLSRPGPENTATTSWTDAIIFNEPTIVVERVNLFETRIIGRLAGGVALFDETYDAAFDSPTVQAGVQAARVAITSAGGPGVVVLVSDPVLISRNVTSTTSSVSSFTLAGMSDTITTTTTFGPATVTIGDARSCGDAIAALPSGARPECGAPGGQQFEVEPGTLNINTETHTEYVVDELRTDTVTETISETYELTGTVVSVGNIHAAALSGIYDLAGHLLFRVGQEGAPGLFGESASIATNVSNLVPSGGGRGWAEGYGFRNRADARDGLPAERRDARGIAAGFSHVLGNGLLVGFGFDHGWLDLEVPDAMETADIELTQFALGARVGSGPFSLALSASYGFGSVDSERSLIAVSTADYDVDVFGLFAEASYIFEAGAWRLVPKLGLDHVRIDSEGFTESGMLGLAVPSHDSDRTRLFPGLEFGRSFPIGNGGALDLTGSVRYLALLGGEERALPVTFTIAPGTPLVMRGLSERDSALIGAQARLRLTPTLDLYLAYDGRFAGGFDSHGATVGLKFVW